MDQTDKTAADTSDELPSFDTPFAAMRFNVAQARKHLEKYAAAQAESQKANPLPKEASDTFLVAAHMAAMSIAGMVQRAVNETARFQDHPALGGQAAGRLFSLMAALCPLYVELVGGLAATATVANGEDEWRGADSDVDRWIDKLEADCDLAPGSTGKTLH